MYDNLDRMRGVESFLNGIPATSIEGLRLGLIEAGIVACHKIGLFAMMGSNHCFLTGKTDTVDAVGIFDLGESGGNFFNGSNTYRLNIPANDFWCVVVYDTQTRSELQTGQPLPSRNNKRDELTVNTDGSVDLYFGPTAPPGHDGNWIQTVKGKSWFTYLRLYGPLDPWFDKTWRPGEVEFISRPEAPADGGGR